MSNIGNENGNTQGVFLTAEEISRSEELKKRKTRTISQLPVFRNATMILSFVVDITMRTPRNARRYTDSSVELANDLLKAIGLANENRAEERILCITDAIVLVYVIKSHLAVYYTKGVLSKDTHNKAKRLCDNTVAQLNGWRDSVKREGCNLQ